MLHTQCTAIYCEQYKLAMDWIEQNLMPHPTQYRSFRRRSSQPITWLLLQTNNNEKTQYKSQKYTHKHNMNQRK